MDSFRRVQVQAESDFSLPKPSRLFDYVVGRESSQESKESGALTKIALEKLGSNPLNTLMIGDAPMDYVSAKNAGINNIILVSTGQIAESELKKISKKTVSSLKEIEVL